MSDEQNHQLPDELRQEFVDAGAAWLEMAYRSDIATKQHFSADETRRIGDTQQRVIEALRRMRVTYGPMPAILFRGVIFTLASHPESLVAVPEDQIRSIDG
jgi:hypothetical protein